MIDGTFKEKGQIPKTSGRSPTNLHFGSLQRKRPKFPSGVGLGSSLSMASWINQREQELNVVFVSVGQLRRSGGL
jgi:hypothetical protein